MQTKPCSLDQKKIRRSFNQAASSYDAVAVMQHEVGKRMIERLDFMRLEPKMVLDVGSGTGRITRLLEKRYPKSKVIAMDIAFDMLALARKRARWLTHQRFICADGSRLPLLDNSVDLIFSNMALHWCGDLDIVFREWHRVLKPNGLLLFSTLGPDTLKELRQSWASVDDGAHVHLFNDMHDIGDALVGTTWSDPVMDVEYFTLKYADIMQLMRELKTSGGCNGMRDRRKTLTGKTKLKSLIEASESYRDKQGKWPATYEVIYGHAWGSAPSPKENTAAGSEVRISADRISRRPATGVQNAG